MSDKFITLKQLTGWLDEQEEALKDRIMGTKLGDKEGREELYHLYQATQLFRSQVLSTFSSEVQYDFNMYDEPNNTTKE